MSSQGILSTEYNRISRALLDFNDAIMLLKDVFLGKQIYENEAVETWVNTVKVVLAEVLYSKKSEADSRIPGSALGEVSKMFKDDPKFRHEIEEIYRRLLVEGTKRGITESEFAFLDRVASSLSESAAQTFRKIWRAG